MTSLALVRRFRAPPARVWHAWTTPEVIALWFGPHHTRVEAAAADLRIGGAFRVLLREDNGERHEILGEYQEIRPEERLVLSWRWGATPERVSRVTVGFRPVPEGTEITVTHDRLADDATATRHTRGWTESLQRLGALLGAA